MSHAEGEEQKQKVFCFREETPAVHLGLARFYKNSLFSDLTIVAPNGQKLAVHQIVLASCSKRFSDVLEQGSLQGEELPVRGVDAGGLDAVLRFFYQGECNLDYNNVIPVYDAAHRLDVPSLVAACESFSNKALAPCTACTLLQHAQQFLMHDYAEQCLAIIRNSFEQVTLVHTDFLTSSFQTLARILTDATSHQADEAVVFRAAWRWGTAEISHMQFLPEILKVVKVPGDLSVEELMKLSTPVKDGQPGVPAWPSLQQVLLQHVLAGCDIATAVCKVADEAASVSLANQAAAAAAAAKAAAVPAVPNQVAAQQQQQAQLQAVQLLQQAGALGGGMVGSGHQRSGSGGMQPLMLSGHKEEGDMMGGMDPMSGMKGPGLPSHGYTDANGMPIPVLGGYLGSGQRMAKGLCQVEGCYQDLTGLRDYHARYKICETHLKAPSILKDGSPQRFCQQCGRFHPLDEFDGDKRSCRARLMKHNARRRKKADEGGQMDGLGMGSGSKHQRLDMGGYQHQMGGYYGQQQQQRYDPATAAAQAARAAMPGGGLQQTQQQQLQSSLALALLANAAQQHDGGSAAAGHRGAAVGGDAAAMALSALGALAAGGDDAAQQQQQQVHDGGDGSVEDPNRAGGPTAQQILAEIAAGNGLAAWQLAALQGAVSGGSEGANASLESLLALANGQLRSHLGGEGEGDLSGLQQHHQDAADHHAAGLEHMEGGMAGMPHGSHEEGAQGLMVDQSVEPGQEQQQGYHEEAHHMMEQQQQHQGGVEVQQVEVQQQQHMVHQEGQDVMLAEVKLEGQPLEM